MYKIIGADQKEYGPVHGEQIRQWISEGRLNGQSLAKSEAGGDWLPLSSFEEFADLFRPPTPTPAYTPGATPTPAPAPMPSTMPSGSRDAALQAVKAPAIALIATSSIGVVFYLLGAALDFLHLNTLSPQQLSQMPPFFRDALLRNQGTHGGLVALLAVAINAFVLVGAIRMLRLQSRSMAMAACIVAMVPCSCCCLLGVPFGIWGLVVLSKPEVKSAF